jgi:prepilin-type N-terminal cleavage/methylation domain-containing protein
MNTELNAIETKATKDEKGFTLVELLIVIVILGILSTIVVFSVRGLTGKANTNACKIDHRSMSTAIEGYYADKGAYPVSSAVLLDPDGNAATEDGYMTKASSKWVYSGGAPSTMTAVAPCVAGDAS